MSEKELKPCPFCGAEDEVSFGISHSKLFDEIRTHHHVECAACGVIGPSCETDEEALEGWNRRATPPGTEIVPKGTIEALQKAPVHRLGEPAIDFILRYKDWYREHRVPVLTRHRSMQGEAKPEIIVSNEVPKDTVAFIQGNKIVGLITNVKPDQGEADKAQRATENHFGQNVFVTRKGAVRARQGDLGIIPGSMGQRSFIVRGKGNPESFCSCSHGAGRRHSRNEAKKIFTIDDLAKQTEGVECRKDEGVLDEIPGAYKPIDEVMANQADLVDIVAELKAVICVKG